MIFIGVGSSIGDAEKTFEKAEGWLDRNRVKVLRKSKNHITAPVGGVAKNPFTNAVWEVKFIENPWQRLNWCLLPDGRRHKLQAFALLKRLQACEKALGRIRTKRWDDRIIDLDILLVHQARVQHPTLRIPHPEMKQRAFVLDPLSELVDKNFEIPKFGTLEMLRNRLAMLTGKSNTNL